ncbi:hypothetical protein H6P81_004322 [Aristolochia fimbriata]|uniref:WRC domain-containing protein n=1 Tax=Aristolochia fimbriata TaxID=158543 RepID=A0AAV7FGQ3_ARIFI|nr:hypothetical protein H6P81_004322 [Aristolochia fimbriata]
MRIRNSSRVGFAFLSPSPGSSFARYPSVEKPEEAKQYYYRYPENEDMRRGGGELRGSLQEGETEGEVHRRKNQMLTLRGLEDRSTFDASESKRSLGITNGGGGVPANIIEQALHGKEKEERLAAAGERSTKRRRETNTKNSGAQISQGNARWMEREAVNIPLKKRKAISYGNGETEAILMEKGTNTDSKKRKIPRNKRVREEEAKESEEAAANGTGASTGAKKQDRSRNISKGSTVEGSRCSRINGRGWRCCQQTLVGYSLCEHHLGKGRLRSMSAVRGRATHLGGCVVVDRGDAKPEDQNELRKKKRRKLGIVKARSISSLLMDETADTTPNPSNNQLLLPFNRNIPSSFASTTS